jgi:hypothetical protein
VVSFTPQPLYLQGKSTRYPLDRRLGGPQSHSGRGGEEKNSHPPPGIEPYNPDRPARSPTLYRLSYHGCNVTTDLREIRWGGLDWLHVAHNRGQWRAFVNTVMNLRFRKMRRNS